MFVHYIFIRLRVTNILPYDQFQIVKSIWTDTELDMETFANEIESAPTRSGENNKNRSYTLKNGAGRRKKRLPNKGRKKSSVFVHQVQGFFKGSISHVDV